MKKFVYQCVVAALCLFAVSCSGGGSSSGPTDVAKKICNAMVKKDANTVIKYLKTDDDLSAKEAAEAKELIKGLLEYNPPVKYEIKGEKLSQDGTRADISVKFTDKDGKEENSNLTLHKTDKGWKMDLVNGFN